MLVESFLFFFQAEDGIRDFHVTGVQTCALPIYLDQRGLAGPDATGDDDEAFALLEAIAKIGHRALVAAAFEIEAGIRRETEGFAAELVKWFVHSVSRRRRTAM